MKMDIITLLNVSKHEISVARQRYRLGTTHFATLKSFTQWYIDKKQSSGAPPSYFELHITFSERSLQNVTQYSRNTTPVDTDLVTATETAAITILRLGRLQVEFRPQTSHKHSKRLPVCFITTTQNKPLLYPENSLDANASTKKLLIARPTEEVKFRVYTKDFRERALQQRLAVLVHAYHSSIMLTTRGCPLASRCKIEKLGARLDNLPASGRSLDNLPPRTLAFGNPRARIGFRGSLV